MLDKYWEFIHGVLDRCAECEGIPMMGQHGKKKEFIVECDGCDQIAGPAASSGEAMVEWNIAQRTHDGGEKVST